MRHVTATVPRRAGATKSLSEREIEVVRALAQGRTNQEIAAELFISLSTVKSHLTGIQHKLGLRNRVEIVTWAWENQVVATPWPNSEAESSPRQERAPDAILGGCAHARRPPVEPRG
ncbi:response regulator transcription factor [Amycolatopsis sp. NPDC004625]|uniref:response regulator transcription factor n=1 Tax=Amycolatopsis sp. NPDC004625 TaxID=3154670 RepID=UPI0033AA738C